MHDYSLLLATYHSLASIKSWLFPRLRESEHFTLINQEYARDAP
jgi:hypothetical protein